MPPFPKKEENDELARTCSYTSDVFTILNATFFVDIPLQTVDGSPIHNETLCFQFNRENNYD